jgi:hypothetical protein
MHAIETFAEKTFTTSAQNEDQESASRHATPLQ